jgi:hypothetical protein
MHRLEESPSVASPMMVQFLPNPMWWQREVLNPLLSGPTCAGSANNMASSGQMAHGYGPELQAAHCDGLELQERLMVDGLEIQAEMMAGNLLPARPELPSQTPQTSAQLPQSPTLGSPILLFDKLRMLVTQPPTSNKNLKVYSRRRPCGCAQLATASLEHDVASTVSPTLDVVEVSTQPCEEEGNQQGKLGSDSASDHLECRSEPTIQPEQTQNLSHVA